MFGFGLLTVAISIGFLWLPRAFQQFSYTDPKLIGTVFTWGLYGVGLIAKRIGGLQGRRLMMLEIFGFLLALFSMSFINIFFSGFHKFF
jgi:ABC-type transport system involved in cytochrome c biogenesis permease subunit